jgi:hypothetical protein
VNPFFVSQERLARQAYRYDGRYRLAAFVLLLAAFLQIPFLVLLFHQNQLREEQAGRLEIDLQEKAQLTSDLGSLKETEGELNRIKSWEPILRSRMPTSALLGALEQAIPRDAVLTRIAFEGANYRSVSLGSGSFRVPETYTITLEGEQKVMNPGAWQKFLDAYLAKLPPGSKVVTTVVERQQEPKTGTVRCKTVIQAQADGNYFSLGVKKIEAEENL